MLLLSPRRGSYTGIDGLACVESTHLVRQLLASRGGAALAVHRDEYLRADGLCDVRDRSILFERRGRRGGAASDRDIN